MFFKIMNKVTELISQSLIQAFIIMTMYGLNYKHIRKETLVQTHRTAIIHLIRFHADGLKIGWRSSVSDTDRSYCMLNCIGDDKLELVCILLL